MTLAEQDQIGRELIDISKRLNKLESTIEKLMASRAIHMDSVGTKTPKTHSTWCGECQLDADMRVICVCGKR